MRSIDASYYRPLVMPTATPKSSSSSASSSEPLNGDEEEVLRTAPSMLDQAQEGAEEMSMLFSSLARRNLAKKSGNDAALEENFDQVLDSDVLPKVEKVVALALLDQVSVEALLRYAKSLFPDDSDLVLILRELLRQRNLKQIARKKLQAVLDQVLGQADPKSLKAGINGALKARLFGARMAVTPAALRQCYRQFLADLDAAIAQYQGWIGDFGAEKRAQVVEFIEAALFVDMNALDPSCTRLEFRELLKALRQLRLLRSSDEVFVKTLLRVWEHDEALSVWLLLSVLQQPYDLPELLEQHLGPSMRDAAPSQRSRMFQALLSAFKQVDPEQSVLDEAREFVLSGLAAMADQAYRVEVKRLVDPATDGKIFF